jgi:DNA-binding NarL/FixJ family response regulator
MLIERISAARRSAGLTDLLAAMPITVLICDDLESVRSMLRRLLERDGLIVAGVAGCAEEVLTRYQEVRPDIVLLDYRMPGANGLSLLRALLVRDPDACVVMCSGVADPDVRDAALRLGAADWILKPIYSSSLVASLRKLVRGNKSDAERKSVRHGTSTA